MPLSVILIGCGIVVMALAVASLCMGRYSVDFLETIQILFSPLTGTQDAWPTNDCNVVMNIRLPRVLAAFLVGAALALSGASYQGVLQNPLVSPDILGVSYGACVGAALSILLYMNTWQTQIFAFVGGLVTVFITVTIPKFMHRHSNVMMVLSGIVGSDNKRLIPTVILVAAAFMILVDLFARNISGYEIPLGILTGLVGAPIFGYILIKQRDVD